MLTVVIALDGDSLFLTPGFDGLSAMPAFVDLLLPMRQVCLLIQFAEFRWHMFRSFGLMLPKNA